MWSVVVREGTITFRSTEHCGCLFVEVGTEEVEEGIDKPRSHLSVSLPADGTLHEAFAIPCPLAGVLHDARPLACEIFPLRVLEKTNHSRVEGELLLGDKPLSGGVVRDVHDGDVRHLRSSQRHCGGRTGVRGWVRCYA